METGKCKKYPIVCGFSPVKSSHPAVLSYGCFSVELSRASNRYYREKDVQKEFNNVTKRILRHSYVI